MKKLMIAAVAMAAGVAMAGDEGIVSANCVGYQTFAIEDGFDSAPAGAAFTPINAEKKWTCTTKVFDTEAAEGDVVYIFNIDPAIWDNDSYYCKGCVDDVFQGWTFTTTDPTTGEMFDTDVASFDLSKGEGVLFQPGDMITPLTISGEVADLSQSATWELPADSDTAVIMNPFPVDTKLAELEAFAVDGDVLYIFNQDPAIWDFDSYYYGENEFGTPWSFTTTDTSTGEQYGTGVTADEALTRVAIKAGASGVYQAADTDGRTWTVTISK